MPSSVDPYPIPHTNCSKVFLVALGFQILFASLTFWGEKRKLPHLLPLSTSKYLHNFIYLSTSYRGRCAFLHTNPTIYLCPQSHFLQLPPEPGSINYLPSRSSDSLLIFPLLKIHIHQPKINQNKSSLCSVVPLRLVSFTLKPET